MMYFSLHCRNSFDNSFENTVRISIDVTEWHDPLLQQATEDHEAPNALYIAGPL